MNTVMNFHVSHDTHNFSTYCGPVSFSGRTLLHGVSEWVSQSVSYFINLVSYKTVYTEGELIYITLHYNYFLNLCYFDLLSIFLRWLCIILHNSESFIFTLLASQYLNLKLLFSKQEHLIHHSCHGLSNQQDSSMMTKTVSNSRRLTWPRKQQFRNITIIFTLQRDHLKTNRANVLHDAHTSSTNTQYANYLMHTHSPHIFCWFRIGKLEVNCFIRYWTFYPKVPLMVDNIGYILPPEQFQEHKKQ